MSVQPELEAAIQFNHLFQYQAVATEAGFVVEQGAPEINPAGLSRLLREALPTGQPGDLELRHPFNVIITATSIAGDDYNQYLPDVESALDKTGAGKVTKVGVSIILAGLDVQPDEDSPYRNPRHIYANRTGSLSLDDVTANYLLAAGFRRQFGRVKTGFSQPHDTKAMHNFARVQTNMMIAGEVEPAIRLHP